MITNYLSPLEFELSIKRLPGVEFFLQRASIPNISSNPTETPSPFNRLYTTGDKLTYGELSISFIIDESMSNYLEIYNWMEGYSSPQNFDQYKNLDGSDQGVFSDITLLIKNSHKNPNIQVLYKDCFPTSLSDVQLDTTQNDIVYPEATVGFQYNYFKIVNSS